MTRNGIRPRILLVLALVCAWPAPPWASDGPRKQPGRIVSFAPHVTEILFTLGAGDRVVGVGDSSLWPEEARRRPRLGGLLDPRIEAIRALEPDLVILTPSHILHARPLEEAGVETLTLHTNSINEALWAIYDLGALVGRDERARILLDRMVEELNVLYKESNERTRRRALICLGHEADLERMLVLAPNNYLDEVLRLAGGLNVVTPPEGEKGIAVMMTPEEAREAKPEIVIDLLPSEPESPAERQRIEGLWRDLFRAAAPPPRIHVAHDPYLGVPGTRIPESVRKIRRWLFPEG